MASERIEGKIEDYLESIIDKDLDPEEVQRIETRITVVRKLNN